MEPAQFQKLQRIGNFMTFNFKISCYRCFKSLECFHNQQISWKFPPSGKFKNLDYQNASKSLCAENYNCFEGILFHLRNF